jgi:hypothetical protein
MAAQGFDRHEERLDSPATAEGGVAYKGRMLVYRRSGMA